MDVSVKPAKTQVLATIEHGQAKATIQANLFAVSEDGRQVRLWIEPTDGVEIVIPHAVLVKLADLLGEKPPPAPRAPAKPKK